MSLSREGITVSRITRRKRCLCYGLNRDTCRASDKPTKRTTMGDSEPAQWSLYDPIPGHIFEAAKLLPGGERDARTRRLVLVPKSYYNDRHPGVAIRQVRPPAQCPPHNFETGRAVISQDWAQIPHCSLSCSHCNRQVEVSGHQCVKCGFIYCTTCKLVTGFDNDFKIL